MISIANKRTFKDNGTATVVYIGRGSPLGNPFHMHSESERDKVCELYQKYFDNIVKEKSNQEFIQELRRIYKLAKAGDITLLCYCYPKRCHGETIKAFIESFLKI